MTWRNWVATAAMLLLGMLVQTAVLPAMGVMTIAPEILLSILVLCAIFWDVLPAALLGCGFGVLMDILFGRGIGMYALTYLIIVWVAPAARRQFSANNAIGIALYVALCHLLRAGLLWGLLYLVRAENTLTAAMVLRRVLSALLSAGVTLALYYPLRWWYTRRQERQQRYFYRSGF
ncbi:MAG: rod shape-determining protein MreD [Eubacteriales bacterium]|nr:rod shape-determining protein MreD [Eubacteriales bacterium]